MADQVVYKQSFSTLNQSTPFTSKEKIKILDNNNGFYSNSFSLSTAQLANSGKMISFSESELIIPMVVSLRCTDNTKTITNVYNSFKFALKSNYINLIDSLSVSYQNSTVIQLTNRSNFYYNYKFLEQLSESEIDKHFGSLYGIYPDGHESWEFCPTETASLNGYGSTNNKPFSAKTRFAGDSGNISDGYGQHLSTAEVSNDGLYKRCKAQNPNYATTEKGINVVNSQQNAKDMFRNYVEVIDDQTIVTYLLCIIPLKNFSFFERLPLIRGAFVNFDCRFNASLNKLKISDDRMEYTESPLITGNTNPLVFSSAEGDNDQPNATISALTGETEVILACGIVKSKDTSVMVSHPQTAVSLNATLYSLSPKDEELYFQQNSTKRVKYNDIINYTYSVDGNQSFNFLVSPGISNMTKLYILPMYSAESNPVNHAGTIRLSPHQSCFASEPSTCSPLIYFSNFQISIAGTNVYNSNSDYTYAQYIDELSELGLNGGKSMGLSSGLITYERFQNNYTAMVINLGRRLYPESENVPLSLSITGYLRSNMKCDLHCFVEQEKTLSISTQSGAILDA